MLTRMLYSHVYNNCLPGTAFFVETISLSLTHIQAYLDEINTASCLGLFKEIIVDRTINGKVSEMTLEVFINYALYFYT